MQKIFIPTSMLYLPHFLIKKYKFPQVACLILFCIAAEFVFAHGTVISPPSRVWNCYQENPENPDSAPCIAAVASHGTQPLYDWSEINQGEVGGEHMLYVPNGNLASGGRPEKYGGMDQVSSDWVATPVSPGPFTVIWTNSAPHATAYYDIYITNEDWTPDQPLAWDKLTLLIRTSPSSAANTVDIPVTLPERSGKHVIYSVWQRSDSPEAFYSTSDIDFGGTSTDVDDLPSLNNYSLKQCYPNPFKTSSQIEYTLGEGEFVRLKVYDIYGREVSTLINKYQAAGEHEATFNGEDLSDGIYVFVLEAGEFRESRFVVLQR